MPTAWCTAHLGNYGRLGAPHSRRRLGPRRTLIIEGLVNGATYICDTRRTQPQGTVAVSDSVLGRPANDGGLAKTPCSAVRRSVGRSTRTRCVLFSRGKLASWGPRKLRASILALWALPSLAVTHMLRRCYGSLEPWLLIMPKSRYSMCSGRWQPFNVHHSLVIIQQRYSWGSVWRNCDTCK